MLPVLLIAAVANVLIGNFVTAAVCFCICLMMIGGAIKDDYKADSDYWESRARTAEAQLSELRAERMKSY